MSDATKAALEDAIRAHVADEGDGELRLLTDYYLVTAAVSEDANVTCYLHVISEHTPTHTLLGLLHIATRRMNRYWDDDGD